jgi:hypothetical protein
MLVGAFPLGAYLVAPLTGAPVFPLAVAFSIVGLSAAGIARAAFVHKTAARSALEMLLVATLAGAAAYLAGRVGAALIR